METAEFQIEAGVPAPKRYLWSRYGRVARTHRVPYGALVDATPHLRATYYNFGYLKDADLPELPEYEPEPREQDPERARFLAELEAVVAEHMELLPPRLSKVLRLRFGIGCYKDHTLDEISIMFDVSRERIRQIESKALRMLRSPGRLKMWAEAGIGPSRSN